MIECVDTFLRLLYINTHVEHENETTNGCLAQLVEQWTVNPCVAGSKPAADDKAFSI